MSDSLKWVKARASGSSGGNCLEVARLPDRTRLVRDSKDRTGPVLRFSPAAWRRFAGQMKRSLPEFAWSGRHPDKGHPCVGVPLWCVRAEERSRRPARAARRCRPQWSPPRKAGGTIVPSDIEPVLLVAAMEPASKGGRNGPRPRPGRAAPARRNGARLERREELPTARPAAQWPRFRV
jgi:Domain of unknown function (DUF397)